METLKSGQPLSTVTAISDKSKCEALRTEYVNKGWVVQPVDDWTLASLVDGVMKFDVQTISPDHHFVTAQVQLSPDGTVVALSQIVEATPSFTEEVNAFIKTKEGTAVPSIVVTQVYEAYKTAEVTAFIDNAGKVSKLNYLVWERDGKFNFEELV